MQCPKAGKDSPLRTVGVGCRGFSEKAREVWRSFSGDRSGTVPMSPRGLEASAVSIQLQASCGEKLGRLLVGSRQQEDS